MKWYLDMLDMMILFILFWWFVDHGPLVGLPVNLFSAAFFVHFDALRTVPHLRGGKICRTAVIKSSNQIRQATRSFLHGPGYHLVELFLVNNSVTVGISSSDQLVEFFLTDVL